MRKKEYKKTKNYGIDETNNRVHKKINKQKNSDYNQFSKSINRNCESFHAIKGVIFDFDNTLEVWGSGPEKRASREWANIISKKEGLNAKVFLRLLREIKRYRL
ncbi:MAG: hypothetical protein GWP09_01060, partial [Nitrospiraceae bacterium]|nr:hypothetical protein [Nitrospiraceae bacterium]